MTERVVIYQFLFWICCIENRQYSLLTLVEVAGSTPHVGLNWRGTSRVMYLSRLEPGLFFSTVRTNLDGASYYSCQAAARQMARQGHGGSITGVSSTSALVGEPCGLAGRPGGLSG